MALAQALRTTPGARSCTKMSLPMLNNLLQQYGPQALPYPEQAKWTVRDHLLELQKVCWYPMVCLTPCDCHNRHNGNACFAVDLSYAGPEPRGFLRQRREVGATTDRRSFSPIRPRGSDGNPPDLSLLLPDARLSTCRRRMRLLKADGTIPVHYQVRATRQHPHATQLPLNASGSSFMRHIRLLACGMVCVYAFHCRPRTALPRHLPKREPSSRTQSWMHEIQPCGLLTW